MPRRTDDCYIGCGFYGGACRDGYVCDLFSCVPECDAEDCERGCARGGCACEESSDCSSSQECCTYERYLDGACQYSGARYRP